MTTQDSLTQALAFLRSDPLQNIVPLKMLTAHPQVIDIHYAQNGQQEGLLLLFPTTAFAYDRQSYPNDQWIALLSVTDPSVVEQFLPLLPTTERIIFKLNSEEIHAQLAKQLPLQRVTAFHSFTAQTVDPLSADPTLTGSPLIDSEIIDSEIIEGHTIDQQLYPILAQHGHDRRDLDELRSLPTTHTFTLYRAAIPVAACMTYQNFETIHEIGGVVTLPEERRKGYAKKVVTTAIASLHRRSLRPRYQVHEVNTPSIRLAEAIGLQRFTIIEHWRYQPQ